MRVFVALVLPDPFRHALVEATAGLCASRSDLRWIAAPRLHLTLAFIGELDDRGTDIVVEAAERAAKVARPFTLGSAGLLALPRRGAARVLAASIGKGSKEAAALADALESALAEAGRETAYPLRPRETRPFTAHVTLARAGRATVKFAENELVLRPSEVRASAGSEAAERAAAEGLVAALAVYESLLGSGEARYRELARVELGTGRRLAQ